ncbi:HAD family phosphatase [Streptomyces sp. NPDC005732]|uniref:HAD family hydrolase n=1 Tax=Streptomyces sp. NPDC005732 TaxID=3157057 RepID=UPI0033E9621D
MSHRIGLVLDFGGVLTTTLLPAVLAFEKREGLAEGACLTALYLDEEGTRLTHALERGEITQDRWNRAAAERLGVAPENLMGRIFADLRPEPLMIDAVAAIRRAGIKVGILSNSVGLAPWNLYDGYDLDALSDAVVISEHHGVRKPDPEIFEAALRLLELPADQCVFVDDTAEYLPAAESLGFATVHAQAPERTIARLEDLLSLSLADEVRTAPRG